MRVLRGGVLYGILGPPIGAATFALYAALAESQSVISSPTPPDNDGFAFLFVMMLMAYPFAGLPAFLTGTLVGLVSYKGVRERRSWLALKSFAIGAIVSFLYFRGGGLWHWDILEREYFEFAAPMVAAGSVAAAVCAMLFYRYVNPYVPRDVGEPGRDLAH